MGRHELAGRRFVEHKYDIKRLDNELASVCEEVLRAKKRAGSPRPSS